MSPKSTYFIVAVCG